MMSDDDRLAARILHLLRNDDVGDGASLDDLALWLGEGSLVKRVGHHARTRRRIVGVLGDLHEGGLVAPVEGTEWERWTIPGAVEP